MTDLQWKRAWEVFETVNSVPEDAARALLDASTEDPAVVGAVREMLDSLHDEDEPNSSTPTEIPQSQYAGCTIGRYDVIALIGRGSTGEVYSGRDRELERPVALKFMSSEYANVGSAAQRFIREAQAASALNHPNIVTVYEVITWNSSPVIVMELVDGTALRSFCGQPLPLPRMVRIGSQIMEAVAFAHSIGIVHRDLKPENVMLRPDGYVKVLDFGLARQTILEGSRQNLSSTAGLPVGTLRYMSPEQCRGEVATAASDVFAAGIVLFEMIAGRHPFCADSPLDTAHAIAWLDPAPLTQLNPAVPPQIHALITRMLAKDATARPSAAEVAEALAADRAPAALPPPALQRPYLLIGLTLAAVLVMVLGWALWSGRSSKRMEAEFQISPLASLLGTERQPSFSADGSRVAFSFSAAKETTSHIYIKTISSGELTRLTSDSLPDFQPAFSPDGSRLAFLRRADGRLRVMVTPSTGGVEHQVGEIMDVLREYAVITWDSEGQNVIVADRANELRPEVALFQISVETGARKQITFPPAGTSDWMPSSSPDRGTLGYARVNETGRGDLWEVPFGGGNARRITDANDVFFCWSWSANGQDVLISYRRSGRVHLWRQPVSGGPQMRVTGFGDPVMEISVARKGGLLVYGSGVQDDYNVWRYSTAVYRPA
jgi:serine/threonine protein kinase